MDLIAYLDIFRRRWVLVLACGALAFVALLVTMPSKQQIAQSRISYSATATLISNGGPDAAITPAVMGLYATVGEVPKMAARRLGTDMDPQSLASMITTNTQPETGTLTITADDPNRRAAENRANAFAVALVTYLKQHGRDQVQSQIDDLDRLLADYTRKMDALTAEIAQHPGQTDQLSAQRSALASGRRGDHQLATMATSSARSPLRARSQSTSATGTPFLKMTFGGK